MNQVNSDGRRFERKFVISGYTYREIEWMIKLNPGLFSEAFHVRQVNNIYFDTHDFQSYHENLSGIAERKKIRIRWYGPLFGPIAKPVLEFKLKNSLSGTKESYRLRPFTLDPAFSIQTVSRVIQQSDIPGEIKEQFTRLNPVLLNRYTRRYFLSASKQFRITLDHDLEFFGIGPRNNFFMKSWKDLNSAIVELKYPADLDDMANRIAARFPIRMSKSSKYVNGIDKFWGSGF